LQLLLSRRQLLGKTALLPLVAFAGPVFEGCADAPACADPELMSTGEAHLRRTLAYVERSLDGSKECGGCEFFRAGSEGQGECGRCQILDGAVNPRGSCSSWAERR